jgi:hypothetical protein
VPPADETETAKLEAEEASEIDEDTTAKEDGA